MVGVVPGNFHSPMKKTSILLAALLGLVTANLARAQASNGSIVPPSVTEKVLPTYPVSLLNMPVKSGIVKVALSIDTQGNVADILVIRYTRSEFAITTVSALKKWRFTPAMRNDTPVESQTELTFTYENTGIVVISDFAAIVDTFLHGNFQNDDTFVYRPCSLKEIDRIPVPLNAAAPIYTPEMVKQGIRGQAQIEFFIDENGTVRMPSVARADQDILAALAINAVRQWKFEPPTNHGKPVLVKAQQVFTFNPTNAKVTTP